MTEGGTAHMWTAAGNMWKTLAELLPAKDLTHSGPFRVRHLQPSVADPRVVVVTTNTSTSWLTKDGGVTWTPVTVGLKGGETRLLSGWVWHPSEQAWALAEAVPRHRSPAEKRRRSTVFYTQDSGATWKLLSKDVEQCQWSLKVAGNKTRILLTRYVDTNDVGAKSSQVELLDTSDFMATHRTLIGSGAASGGPASAVRVELLGGFVVAVGGAAAAGGKESFEQYLPNHVASAGHLELWLARDDGRAAPRFEAALWPGHVEPLHSRQLRRLQVIHVTEQLVLLFVPAADSRLPWGHVFGWTPGRPELELLLTDVEHRGVAAAAGAGAATETSSGLSFHGVDGVDGVLIASRVVVDEGQGDLDRAERRFDGQSEALREDPEPGGEEEAPGQRYAVRTYISVNQGLAWQPLHAPTADAATGAAPLPAACAAKAGAKSPCSLHLVRWASAAAAPGIVLGVGNVGLRLSDNPEHHSVFLSRDAGLTWRSVLPGPHLVSILGHGDALLAAPLQTPGKLVYSLDSGSSWQQAAVPGADASAVLHSVFTHPAHTDLRGFVCLGSDAAASAMLAVLDLSGALFAGACRSPEAASTEASDFESWSPADSLEDSHESKRPSCLFGVRTKYVRRKVGKACRTGATRPAPLDSRIDATCSCSAADWACDAGYHRGSYAPGAPCEPLEGVAPPNVTAMCEGTLDQLVAVTRGYVKLPGNGCTGGVDLAPRLESCPGNVGFAGAIKSFGAYMRSLRVAAILISVVFLLVLWRSRSAHNVLSMKLRRCYGLKESTKKHDDLDDEREFLLPGTA